MDVKFTAMAASAGQESTTWGARRVWSGRAKEAAQEGEVLGLADVADVELHRIGVEHEARPRRRRGVGRVVAQLGVDALPVNLVFLYEGEEESQSAGFRETVALYELIRDGQYDAALALWRASTGMG